jgi:glycosyltransferase involved in cell wall biosynthesis
MTRTLSISLVTLGDPLTMTGGYLYHRRMAELAPAYDARLTFASFPSLTFPLPAFYARRVLRTVRAERPDVVLIDSIAAAFLAPVRMPPGVSVAAILHQPPGGIDHGRPRALVQAALDRRTYRRAARLLVASEPLGAELARQGFSERILVVAPGRDVPDPSPGPAADLRAGADTALLCVANWLPRKGVLDLLDAVAALPDGVARLHLAGDEDADPAYAARVRRRLGEPDLAGRVLRHGRLPKEEIARLYRDADVFVLPSLREPYGTVYGEAMAAGLPVVGWRAGNLPHLARDGREGLVVEPGDVPALTATLAKLCADPALRARLGAAAQRRAEEFPTWEDSAAVFFGTLRELTHRAGRTPPR